MSGLSISSMAVNIAGGVFLILSLAFKERFDVFASVPFAVSVASCPFIFCKDHGPDSALPDTMHSQVIQWL